LETLFLGVDQRLTARFQGWLNVSETEVSREALSLIGGAVDDSVVSVAISDGAFYVMFDSGIPGEGEWVKTPITYASVQAGRDYFNGDAGAAPSAGAGANGGAPFAGSAPLVYDAPPNPPEKAPLPEGEPSDSHKARFDAATRAWQK
jgi:hypothetical protein